MKVHDILKVKGSTIYSISPQESLKQAVVTMAKQDIGSLVVMEKELFIGLLSFREIIEALAKNNGNLGETTVRMVLDTDPLTCTPETELEQVRRMMLEQHARYLPVIENSAIIGVISFYDVAKAVVESQDYENQMLKAYISDISPSATEDSQENDKS
jgi:CBS domain-containing protein